jgi:uncharacterized delta-60 repeat protein
MARLLKRPTTLFPAVIEAIEPRRLMSAGQIDTGYGTMGVLALVAPSGVPVTSSVAVGVDGRQVVTDTYGPVGGPYTTVVTRYSTTGAPDPTFGTGGKVTLAGRLVNKVIIRPSGPIVLVGNYLQQLTTAGAIDLSFAGGGIALNPSGYAKSAVLQLDGKLVVADTVVRRFNVDGSIDTTFGTSGTVGSATIGFLNTAPPLAVTVDSSQRVLVSGGDMVARLTTTGALDTTFGNSGIVDFVNSGSLFAAGTTYPTQTCITIGPDGTVFTFSQADFGGETANLQAALLVTSSNGLSQTEIDFARGTFATADGIAVQADGKVLLLGTQSGYVNSNTTRPYTPAMLERFNPITASSTTNTVTLDTTFAQGGILTLSNTPLPVTGTDRADALAIGPNGGALVTTHAIDSGTTSNEFILTKVQADPSIAAGRGTITGRIFADTNFDGIPQSTETVLPLFGVFLDNNDNGYFDAGDVRAVADAGGGYAFYGLAPGTYTVRQNVPSGYMLSTPVTNPDVVTVTAGGVVTVNYGEAPALAKFTGTVIGTAGSYGNKGNTIANAFDGNLNTFVDAPTASGGWVGLDLGSPQVVKEVVIAPRATFSYRMLGGEIQASNSPDFSTGVAIVGTIATTPAAGVLTPLTLTNTAAYRYYRYIGPAGSYDDIAELAFYG